MRLKKDMALKVSLILGMVLVVGIIGFFLFEGVDDFTSYLFFGELPLTGQTIGSICDLNGGVCLMECIGNNYVSSDSCEYDVFDPGSFTPKEVVSAGDTCCMPDVCGNGYDGVMEECDNGGSNGDVCDNSSSNCNYCSEDCEIIILTYTPASYCGDGTCDLDETCSSCLADCVNVTGAPACEEGKVCEENFGVGTCSISLASSCGNGNVDSGEECDLGTNSNGVSCNSSYGENCTYCSDECLNITLTGSFCGDSIINSGNSEVCDLENLSDSTCISLGFVSGNLTCLNDCSGFDNSSCISNSTAVPIMIDDGILAVIPSKSSSTTKKEIEEVNDTNESEDLNYSLDGIYQSPEKDGTSKSDGASEEESPEGDKEFFSEDFGTDDFSPEAITYRVRNALSSKWGIPIAMGIIVLIVLIIFVVLNYFKVSFKRKKSKKAKKKKIRKVVKRKKK
ncbi:hypothetical protein HOD88_03570 [archaeon]|jgi:hypothetical protein|nr:hypothetical protein [archaeon]